MAFTESDSTLLLPSGSGTKEKAPEDKWHLAYMIYFFLGFGYLLPWNAFITAVDYFSYLYPDASVDRIFAVVYMLVGLFGLMVIILYRHKSHAYVRINLGLALFVVSLLVVPLIDAFYVKGRVGFYGGFYVTAGALGISGVADALVQGSIVGSAGELPERYMQAVIAGTAASGVVVSFLRIFTKAVYTQDVSGLQKSANLYFGVSIVIMFICMVLYSLANKLPIMKYYDEVKIQAVAVEDDDGPLTGSALRKNEFDASFKRISEAFDVLSDPNKRRIYDLYGKYPVDFENGDGNNNMEVDDEGVGVVESDLLCTLEDLYCGCRKKVNLVRTVPDEFGELKREEDILKITIKPGWKKGTKITFPGRGNQLRGSPPLDLIFVVKEKPHAIFQRDRHDLVMTQKISFLEALVGSTLNITTLDRRNITVEVTDIVTPGYEKVVPDEGMPLAKDSSKRGNLRIKFDVEFPSNLTSQQKHSVSRILSEAVYN